MNRFQLLFILSGIIVISNSCIAFRCVEGSGERVRQSRSADSFLGVVSEGAFDVYIEIDTSLRTPQIVVEADENIQPYVQIQTRNQNLEIYSLDNRCLNTAEPVTIDIRCNYLDLLNLKGSGLIRCSYGHIITPNINLELSGSGDIELFDADADNLYVENTGSGKVEVTGYCIESKLNLPGSGLIRAYHLEQNTSYIDLSGSGIIYVWAWDLLDIKLSGSGIVYFKGTPRSMNEQVTGSGQIIPFNSK